jgi:hypothetical protein
LTCYSARYGLPRSISPNLPPAGNGTGREHTMQITISTEAHGPLWIRNADDNGDVTLVSEDHALLEFLLDTGEDVKISVR